MNPAVTATFVVFELLAATVGGMLTWSTIRMYRRGLLSGVYVAVTATQTVLTLIPVGLWLAGFSPPHGLHFLVAFAVLALSGALVWRRRRAIRAGLANPPDGGRQP
jgi:hypothetical protein